MTITFQEAAALILVAFIYGKGKGVSIEEAQQMFAHVADVSQDLGIGKHNDH